MMSERKSSCTSPCDTTFIPDNPDIRKAAAYPSPPNSPCGKKSDTYTTNEDIGQKLCSSAALSSAVTTSPSNSPNPVTRLSNPEAYQSNEAVLLKPSILKKLLRIDDWRCGGLTLEQGQCNRFIAEKLHDDIDTHIDSMVILHPSSPQFQLDLEKLVDLVHCYQHRRGYVKQMRLDSWMEAIPSGPNGNTHGTSIERKIKLCFGRISTQCIGTKGENKRCNKSIGGQKAQNCTKTIEKISQAEIYLNDNDLNHFLQLLATNRLCHSHTKQSSAKELKLWRERIEGVLVKSNLVSEQSKHSNTTDDPQRQVLDTDLLANIPTKENDTQFSTSLEKSSMPFPRSVRSVKNPVTYWLDRYDTTAFDIVERGGRPDDHKASYDGVRRQMMKRMSADDQKNGYLYIYEVEGNKGFVKIGYTTRSIRKRHEEWGFDCNRKSNPLYPLPAIKAALVPNARRVEKLCHAELKHRQAIIYCQGCLKTHEEWFESSPTDAIAVIEKWSAWMKKDPYHPDQLLLKQEEGRKTFDMEKFMDCLLTGDD